MRRILVVDDEKMIVNSLAGYLEEKFDMEVHRVYSAIEAKELLRKMSFSIVITDISMPAMSGLELLDFIKTYWPLCRVIILTAYSNFQYAYTTLKYDRVDYILKIEEYETIRQAVAKHLKLIDQEEQTKAFYDRIDEKVSRMSSYLISSILGRLFYSGAKVEQEELDTLEIPLQLKKPVLLVMGALESCPPEMRSTLIANILRYVEEHMALRKIRTFFHDMDGNLLWLFQLEEESSQPKEDIVVYAGEIFGELSELIHERTGKSLTLAMSSQFVPVSELQETYQKSLSFMEPFRGESCLRMVLEDDNENREMEGGVITGLIRWVNDYIDGHFTEELSLTLLADMANYNPSYLSRLYKEQTGISIVRYINQRRVERAKQLLMESGLKTKDIALQSGFYSVKHFNQVFKKYTGVSAGAFRQQILES